MEKLRTELCKYLGCKNFCFSLLLGLFLMSCAHAPGGAPAQPERSTALPTKNLVERIQRENQSAVNRSNYLTLEQAIQDALERSPELQQILQRIDASAEQIKQAEAAFYPRLIIAEDFNVTNNPVYALMDIINQRRLSTTTDFNNPGQQHNLSSRIQGEWSVFEGGSRWYNRNAAVDEKRSTESNLLAARSQLITKVTETYYRWLQALGFVEVAERALEAARTDEKLGEARFQVEMALPSEVLRLKTRTAEAESNLVTARTGARRLQAGLERLIARRIGSNEIPNPNLTVALPAQNRSTQDEDALFAQALDRRPEMAAIRSLIEAARKRVKAAQGGLLPRIGTSANYQWDSEDLSNSADSWWVGVKATWALFEGGLTLSQIRQAKTHLQELQARGEQVALDIALEIQQATLAVQEAAEKIRVTNERKKWARKALEEVRNLYRNQVVTVDSLLQAEVAWNQAEVSHTAALFEGKIAQALLMQSLGDFADSSRQYSSANGDSP